MARVVNWSLEIQALGDMTAGASNSHLIAADALIHEIYASPPAVVKLAIDVMKETN